MAAVAGFCPFHWRRDDDGRSTLHVKPFDPSALLQNFVPIFHDRRRLPAIVAGFFGWLCAIGMSSIGGVGDGRTQLCIWRASETDAYSEREAV